MNIISTTIKNNKNYNLELPVYLCFQAKNLLLTAFIKTNILFSVDKHIMFIKFFKLSFILSINRYLSSIKVSLLMLKQLIKIFYFEV